jgi:DNA-binding XRE family transcriptional regulator
MQVTLKAARVNAGFTITEASKLIGISRNTLINWEMGRSYPNIIQMPRICEIYKATPDDIFFAAKVN